MNERTVQQLYKLLSSYQRERRWDRYDFESLARDAAEEATSKTFSATQYRLSSGGRKLLAAFAACAALTVGSAGYSFWQSHKTQQVMKDIIDGNPVITVGNDVYAVLEEKGNGHCHQFVAGKVLMWTNNNRPGFVDADHTVRFRIPEACKP